MMKYVQALQTAEFIAKICDTKKEMKIRNIWDYYPELFNEEKQRQEKEQEEENFFTYKQKRQEYAKMHNTRFGGDAACRKK